MSRKTPALVEIDENSGFILQEVSLDALRSDEALVRIEATGICATDLNHKPGFYPAIKGHEGCGVIEELGADLAKGGEFRIGERVLLCWGHCMECANCKGGMSNYCTHMQALCFGGRRLDGSVLAFLGEGKQDMAAGWFSQSSFSKWTICHWSTLIKLPDHTASLPSTLLAAFCCGTITGAGSVANVLKPERSKTIAICGTGNVGLTGLMMAKHLGAGKIIAADRDEGRLGLAKELGATETVLISPSDDEESIMRNIAKAAASEQGLGLVLDTTGYAPLIRGAFRAMSVRGVFCSVAGHLEVALKPAEIYGMGKTWTGALQGDCDPRTFIPLLINLHLEGKFPIDRLIKVYPPEEVQSAVQDMLSGKVFKGVIDWTIDTRLPTK